ncbi:MAG: GNAT family N-acetyltransferase [bacterium]|nr:GNAT family N-acetyltransferase [bacterium]
MRSSLTSLFRHELLGEIALDWAELIRSTVPGGDETIVYRIFRGDQLRGMAIVSVVRGLDPERYLWRTIARLLKRLVRFNVGFLEIPLLNMPGLLTLEGVGRRERGEMVHALRREIRANLNLDTLLIKMDGSIDLSDNASPVAGMLPLSFYPNTLLDYPYLSFEAYLQSRPSKKRRKYRAERRALERLGGTIEVVEDIAEIAGELYALYANTAREVKKRPHSIEMPMTINQSFYANIASFPRMAPRVVVIRVGGVMIANALLLQSGKTLFLKAVGLDYDLSYKSRAYFNLFYAALEYASAAGCTQVDFGVTSYPFKQGLGSELKPAAYACDIYNPLLAACAGPLRYGVERRIGTRNNSSPFAGPVATAK